MPTELIDPRVEEKGCPSMDDTPVKLIVGESHEIIVVHPSILSKSSRYFKSALKKEWLTEPREIQLPYDDIETITAYVHWLYTGNIRCDKDNSTYDAKYNQYVHLAKMYALGERLMDTTMQNIVIDAMVATRRDKVGAKGGTFSPVGDAVNIIYDSTPSGSPARKLLVDIWHDFAGDYWMTDWGTHDLHSEFVRDVLQAVLKSRKLPEQKQSRCAGVKEGVPSAYYK